MPTRIVPLLSLALLVALSMFIARAAELPSVERIQEHMGVPAATIAVHEPHLSLGDRRVTIEYVGYPAADVMARLFGKDWQEQAGTVELRALDGYVARIDVARFVEETAFLAFARADGAPSHSRCRAPAHREGVVRLPPGSAGPAIATRRAPPARGIRSRTPRASLVRRPGFGVKHDRAHDRVTSA